MSEQASVAGPLVRRGIGLSSFADITDVPVAAITRDAVVFDGPLDADQIEAVWWRISSRDDADEARRRALAAALEAEGVDPLVADLARYVLGLPGDDLGDDGEG